MWSVTFPIVTILAASLILSGLYENFYWYVFMAILLSLSHLSNDLVLFLYVHLIWVASVDAPVRSWNKQLENSQDKTMKEKEMQRKSSPSDKPRILFWKYFFIISLAFVIGCFCVARIICLPAEEPEVPRMTTFVYPSTEEHDEHMM